ncbi:MAG: hypothetical protein DI539_05750 [Flavobacterium psychrophilum]|nr:MAG: hypothetical protein DI539_05750 [Flavobacterium psychrophilum]
MKKIIALALLLSFIDLYSQSIITTTSGKSGILVGAENDFAGISYENASDKFTFNYKSTRQEKLDRNETDQYPNFHGSNISIGIKTDKNKSKLISDGSWQGGVEMDYTLFWTKDNRSRPEKRETEEIPGGSVVHNELEYKQCTWYGKLTGAVERIYTFQTVIKYQDTTYVTLDNPLQTTSTLTVGFYKTIRFKTFHDFSWGISSNISYITNSVRKLKESTLTPLKGTYLNQEDNSPIINIGKQISYYNGISENEIYVVPRADIFYRYNLGEKKPIIGIIASYSPLISSLKKVPVRNCFAIGPSFGLPSFSDHVVFAIFNEFIQNENRVYKYQLTFNASIPLKFK